MVELDEKLRNIPFDVPEGYFSAMEAKALDAVKKNAAIQTKRRHRLLVSTISAAAGVAAAIVAVAIIFTNSATYSGNDYYADNYDSSLSVDEIAEYLIESGVSLEEMDY